MSISPSIVFHRLRAVLFAFSFEFAYMFSSFNVFDLPRMRSSPTSGSGAVFDIGVTSTAVTGMRSTVLVRDDVPHWNKNCQMPCGACGYACVRV